MAREMIRGKRATEKLIERVVQDNKDEKALRLLISKSSETERITQRDKEKPMRAKVRKEGLMRKKREDR